MIIYSLDVLLSQYGTNLQCKRLWFNSWARKISWRRDRVPTPVFFGFPGELVGKESTCNAGDLSSIPVLGRSPGEGMETHSSILAWRIPTDKGAWGATVHGVAKSQTWLSDFHTSLHKWPAIWKNLNLFFPGYSWWGFQTCTSPLLSLILLDITENKIQFNTG